jgi:hypothetical protein
MLIKEQIQIKRTNSNDIDFQKLIAQLDQELWNKIQEDQATYDKYNKVSNLGTVVIACNENIPAGCGCFKKYDDTTVEIKRMFVIPESRGKGIAKAMLNELETWAKKLGYSNAILETGKRMVDAHRLYTNSGYSLIENYGPYIGLDESICMKKELSEKAAPSEFKNMNGIEYFEFEEDFIEENVRCIPMIVRFKMDIAGIKLKLSEWSKFNLEERKELAMRSCTIAKEAVSYNNYLKELVKKYTGRIATEMEVEKSPAWAEKDIVPGMLVEKAKEFEWVIPANLWKSLTDLQRFAILKLCKPGHENRNFPKAMKEFKLV